jgi:hypothetical protein
MQVSAHRRFVQTPHGGFRPRTAYARPVLPRAAYGALPWRRHHVAYRSGSGRPAYRVSHARAYWVHAPIYGATIAGPSPSKPLYNRPSCHSA